MAKAAHLILVINVSDLIALSLDFLGAHAHSHPNPEWVFAGQALGGPKIPKKETKPLIRPEQFAQVQRLLQNRSTKNRKPEEFYLKEMRRILAREGKLAEKLLKRRGIFDHRAYIRRFGSTLRAYELVGFKPCARTLESWLGYKRFQRLRANLINRLLALFSTQLK